LSWLPTDIEPCLPQALPGWAEGRWKALRDLDARTAGDALAIEDAVWNLAIEGIDADPREVEATLLGEERGDPARMAANHVLLVREMRRMQATVGIGTPLSAPFLSWLHARLFDGVSREGLELADGVALVPGEIRWREGRYVSVGRHEAPDSPSVKHLLQHLSWRLGQVAPDSPWGMLAIAAGHHRILHIHPHDDGNGRVSRLAATAMAIRSGLRAGTSWSLCRALARSPGMAYHAMLARADSPRRGDMDGRGGLSQSALVEFCDWFTDACIAEIRSALEPAAEPDRTSWNLPEVPDEKKAELSPPAIRTISNVAVRWRLSDDDVNAILGWPGVDALSQWKASAAAGESFALPDKQLLHASALLGIYESAAGQCGGPDDEVRLLGARREGTPWCGRSAMERMRSGYTGEIMAVRKWLAAICAGN
jgi:Fic family protein